MKNEQEWDLVIKPRDKWYSIDLAAVWKYRDLLMLLVRRDFVSVYKQTVLGPLWFLIQPIVTSLTFTIIFGTLAKISTGGVPPILFYLSGITLWSYFADCLNKTSNTFVANASVFGKVYFPRLIVPLSVLISNLVKLSIQLLLLIVVWIYYLSDGVIHPHWSLLWLIPFLVVMMAALGLGFGIFISSVTTRYRDFTFLIGFGVQLLMYASPIVYPLSIVSPKFRFYILLNPVSSIIESFKAILLGDGVVTWHALLYSAGFTTVLLFIAIVIFNKVEKTFMDTV